MSGAGPSAARAAEGPFPHMSPKKTPKRLQQIARKMKAFIIAFAAVITAAYAPQTRPFKRLLQPPPTVPYEAPVTPDQLKPAAPTASTPATSDEVTARRRGRDRTQGNFLRRLRSTHSNIENRRHSPRRRFSFFLRLRKRGLDVEAHTNPDPPSCPIMP